MNSSSAKWTIHKDPTLLWYLVSQTKQTKQPKEDILSSPPKNEPMMLYYYHYTYHTIIININYKQITLIMKYMDGPKPQSLSLSHSL